MKKSLSLALMLVLFSCVPYMAATNNEEEQVNFESISLQK